MTGSPRPRRPSRPAAAGAIGRVPLVAPSHPIGGLVGAPGLAAVPKPVMTGARPSPPGAAYPARRADLAGPTVPGRVLGALVGFGAVHAAAGSVVLVALIREVGPTRAVVFPDVNPAVAVAAGCSRSTRR